MSGSGYRTKEHFVSLNQSLISRSDHTRLFTTFFWYRLYPLLPCCSHTHGRTFYHYWCHQSMFSHLVQRISLVCNFTFTFEVIVVSIHLTIYKITVNIAYSTTTSLLCIEQPHRRCTKSFRVSLPKECCVEVVRPKKMDDDRLEIHF